MFDDEIYKIVIADDYELVRNGIKYMLNVQHCVDIVGEAIDGEQVVAEIKRLEPDVALIDIMMPRMSGVEVVRQLKEEKCTTKLIMLTAYEDIMHIEAALAAGADGYLSKTINAAELVKAIKNAKEGKRVIGKSILDIIEAKADQREEKEFVTISPREQEVLNLLAYGKTSKEISEELFLSIRTVQAHRSNIMQKLGIKNAAGLVRFAVLNYKDKLQHNVVI